MLLDQYSLELTEQCKTHLNAVKDVESLSKFLDLFGKWARLILVLPIRLRLLTDIFFFNKGEFFSTRVQLGGRLYASEEFTSSTTASASEVKNAMKFQAALSFKTDTLKGGPKGGYGDSNGTERIETGAKLETTLQWQANGGNTLLCNKYVYFRKLRLLVYSMLMFGINQARPCGALPWVRVAIGELLG